VFRDKHQILAQISHKLRDSLHLWHDFRTIFSHIKKKPCFAQLHPHFKLASLFSGSIFAGIPSKWRGGDYLEMNGCFFGGDSG